MKQRTIAAARSARGTVSLPGSKSISNRAMLLAALAQGETRLRGLLDAQDTQVMRAALGRLGICMSEEGETVVVTGRGGGFAVDSAELSLGNAGTAMRALVAALAFSRGRYRVDGVARMRERPIGDLVDALRRAGKTIRYLGAEGFPPLEIDGQASVPVGGTAAALATAGVKQSIPIRGDVSSQFLSALLMALPLGEAATRVEVTSELISRPYVEITLELMRRFGCPVAGDGASAFVVPAGGYRAPAGVYEVEGDASSASYFLAAGAIGGGPVRVRGVGRESIQGDVRFIEVLGAAGASVRVDENSIEVSGAHAGGNLRGAPAAGRRLAAFDLDLNHIPDAAMTAAVLGLFADGPCRIRNIASWRVKETDRLAAMAREFRKFGAAVEVGADFIRVSPPDGPLPAGVAVDTYDDHRMAMCFSLVALGGVAVVINDPDCVGKTFPGYYDALESILVAT